MADTKISALSAVTASALTDEVPVVQSGVNKKATLQQLLGSPTVPTVVAVTASFTSTGVPTATLPTGHTTNDILVLVLQSANDSQVTAPAGYANIGPQNGVGAAAAAGCTKMSIFWKRDGGSEVAPTIPDTGDHTFGFMFAIRGCPTSGDPFRIVGNSQKRTASTTGTATPIVTDLDNCLIVDLFAHARDAAGANASAPTNSGLSSVTEQFDDATADGTGGGLVMVSGTKASCLADAPATTITWTNSTVDVSTTISFIPTVGGFLLPARVPEVVTYFGTAADLDDLWTKPSGARMVFAQLCDGGQGGGGGRSSATAVGGGGGGGGGYYEAWFRARDLAATLTVHAGKGGAGGAADAGGNNGVLSEFNKGGVGPMTSAKRVLGRAATAPASNDVGNGGAGSGTGQILNGPSTYTTRYDVAEATTAGGIPVGVGGRGGTGGSATSAATGMGGSSAEWGGGGGSSGSLGGNPAGGSSLGYSVRGGGGGGGGCTINGSTDGAAGGGATFVTGTQGQAGNDSTMLPYGGSGGQGGGATIVTGGAGGFPGGGGGGGAGAAANSGGKGGDGCVVVTTFFN